jgi:CoA:oxalate CoA-transferase
MRAEPEERGERADRSTGREHAELSARPLDGIRVLDLSARLAGPYATMIFADLGAEVVKVEPPGRGEASRFIEPMINGQSSYFISINRGKRSVGLDFRRPNGRELLLRLVDHSDIFVENFVPGTLEKYDLDYPPVSERNPRIIYTSISGFGQTGPDRNLPAFDIVTQAVSGFLSITGHPGGPPARAGISLSDLASGMFAALGSLAALVERERSGKGQYLDISMLESQVALMENAFTRFFATGEVPRALGNRHPVITPFQAFESQDGYIVIALRSDEQWAPLCGALAIADVATDKRFTTEASRTAHHAELELLINEATRRRPTSEWLAVLRPLGIPCAPVQSVADAASMAQLQERGMWFEGEQPGIGPWTWVNSPLKLSRTPARIAGPSPALGNSTREVLTALCGCTDEELDHLAQEGTVSFG